MHFSLSSFTRFCGILLLLGLSACGLKEKPAAHPKPVPIAGSAAQSYLLNLSLANLAATQNNDAGPYFKELKKLAPKLKGKPVRITVVAMEYKPAGGGDTQRLIVPTEGAASLQKAMRALNAIPHTLHNLRLLKVTVAAPESKPPADAAAVSEHLQAAMQETATPPALESARLYLKLTQFFLREGARDAAYLALENAKQSIAQIPAEQKDAAQELSAQTTALETKLNKTMPYGL